jgi:hypothetical protein
MSEKKEGWEEAFLAGLAAHGNVSRACSEAGIGRTLAYQRREADAEFHDRWLEALDAFADDLESEATRRGRDGTTVPKWHRVGTDANGRPIYERHDIRTYSDALLLARLKALRPELYRESYDADKWLRAALEAHERSKPWKPE